MTLGMYQAVDLKKPVGICAFMPRLIRGRRLKHLLVLFWLGMLSACGGSDNVQPPTPLSDIVNTLEVDRSWSKNTGAGSGKYFLRLVPFVEDDAVFVADHQGKISARSVESGKSLWETDIDLPVTAGVNGGVEMLAVGTDEGTIVALSQKEGKEIWRQVLSSQVTAISRASNGMLVVRSGDGYLYGMEAATGNIVWKLNRTVPALSLHTQSTPIVSRGVVLVGLDDGRLMMVSLTDGGVLWEKAIAVPGGRTELDRMVDIDGVIALIGNVVYVGTYQGKIVAVDAAKGRLLWQQKASSVNGLTVDGDTLFYTDENSAVWALDRRSGASLWKQEALKFRRLTAPVALDHVIVVADYEGYLHWLDRDSGKILARSQADKHGVLAPPVKIGSDLLVLGEGGGLSRWRLDQ